MTALESAIYDDLRQRQQVSGETLTAQEERRLAQLDAKARADWEAEPPPRWLGGDYPDVF